GEFLTLEAWLNNFHTEYDVLSDEARLSLVARGVVRGAGAIGDWRFIAGFYAASLLGAAPQILNSFAGLDSVSIVLGEGEPFHVAVGADGEWIHATDMFSSTMEMTTQGASAYVRGFGWVQLDVPTLAPQAIFSTEGTAASNCVFGACSALWKTVF